MIIIIKLIKKILIIIKMIIFIEILKVNGTLNIKIY